MRNLAARSGCCSVFTLSTIAFPATSLANASTSGAVMRHGPHHGAQKSTRTGTFAPLVISEKASAPASIGVFPGGSGDLQEPHLPASARCFAGTRFSFPHVLHVRVTEKLIVYPYPFLSLMLSGPDTPQEFQA